MAIRVTCPTCDVVNNVDESKRGKKVRCRKCEKPISVPAAVKSGSSLMLILGGVAAVLLFCLLGVGAIGGYYLFGRTTPEVVEVEPKKEDEPKSEPEPEPKREPEPEPKKDPEPIKTEPTLSPELQRVKDATVLVSAMRPDGVLVQGTGFIVGESGLVITTAFAAGSLEPKDPPKMADVTIYPGQANEVKKPAAILGFDLENSLAALRVDLPEFPAPVTFADLSGVAPGQKVHVVGHKSVHAAEIKSIAKTQAGTLGKILVKDSISKDSVGAPVANSAGAVLAIALGGNDTLSSEVVKQFLIGRIDRTDVGKARAVGKLTAADVKVTVIDPLLKVKQVRVEVWTGTPLPRRLYSYEKPPPVPGDSDRLPQMLNFQNGTGTGDVPAPRVIPPGQVIWVQPVITLADGSMQWGNAVVMPSPDSPYDKVPANLTANVLTPDKRTVTLKATHTFTFKDASEKKPITFTLEASILEVMAADPDGATMSLGLGSYSAVNNRDGTRMAVPKNISDIVRQTSYAYTIDNTHKQKKRSFTLPKPPSGDWPKEIKESAQDELFRITSPLDAMMIPLPNRLVQPDESWQTSAGILVRSKGQVGELSLMLTTTYEGLTRDKKAEAVVTIVGKVQARDAKFKDYEGDVTGKYTFDAAKGIITSGQLKLASPAGPDKDSYVLDIDLTRIPGNPQNIKLPTEPKNDPVAKAKIIFEEKKGSLTTKDPFDAAMSDLKKKKHAHYKDFMVPLTQGKKYVIQLDSTAFDAFLKLYAPTGVQIAFDDNTGGGTNARITITAPVSGNYRISAIAHPGKTGAFHLTVTENP